MASRYALGTVFPLLFDWAKCPLDIPGRRPPGIMFWVLFLSPILGPREDGESSSGGAFVRADRITEPWHWHPPILGAT